ncbi:MAG: hypothetical protein AAGK78_04200, partial [Planctomycetota bacterium]
MSDSPWPIEEEKLRRKLAVPSQGRLYYVRYALKMGWTVEQVHELTKIDPWFLEQIAELVEAEDDLASAEVMQTKQLGYSDKQLGQAKYGSDTYEDGETVDQSATVRFHRQTYLDLHPQYKLVDTCAAEFEAVTPYYYSSYETPLIQDGRVITDDEIRVTDRPKVIIIGGGPNRIGQGIEFDYCCVQAAFAAKELDFESVMINSNPETVSTDYDTSDLLFFEPLTHEDVLNICERLNGGPFGSTQSRDREGAPGDIAGKDVSTSTGAGADATASPDDHAGSALAHGRGSVVGVVVQFGGQTPLNLAKGLEAAGVPILGTSVDAIHRAGDREQFRDLLQELGLRQPANGIARSVDEAKAIAKDIGYPVLVRPSFVLGGRAMETVYDEGALDRYMTTALKAAGLTGIADSPILIDKFLDRATEVDVDCVADYALTQSRDREAAPSDVAGEDGSTSTGTYAHATAFPDDHAGPALPHGRGSVSGQSVICGVMEHIEEAGIHSGDSACTLPPYSLSPEIVDELKRQTHSLAKALRVRGLMNVQYAVRDGEVYVIEVNPRASRTVPFVGKATGTPWAKIAAKVMMGQSLADLGVTEQLDMKHVAVKEAVFPFSKFPGVDIILGPEMRSTGEVMGIDETFPAAYAKAQIAEGTDLPTGGKLFISVRDGDKDLAVEVAKEFADLGFDILSTGGTHKVLEEAGLASTRIYKIAEQARPNLADYIKNDDLALIVNTPTRKGAGT